MFASRGRQTATEPASEGPARSDAGPSAPPGPLWSSLALQIEPADSPLEREAETIAARVVSPAEAPPAVNGRSDGAPVQRKCASCELEEEKKDEEDDNLRIQRHADASAAPASRAGGHGVVGFLSSDRGQPLDPGSRAYFGSRFAYDFGDVRIHTGSGAADSARSINALAYTKGQDIVFGAGRFSPHSDGGRELLAHELTHVVQQDGAEPVVQRLPDEAAPQVQKPATTASKWSLGTLWQMASDLCVAETTSLDAEVDAKYAKARKAAQPVVDFVHDVNAGAAMVASAVAGGVIELMRVLLPFTLALAAYTANPELLGVAAAMAGIIWLWDNGPSLLEKIKFYLGALVALGVQSARSQLAMNMMLAGIVTPNFLYKHMFGVYRYLDPMLEQISTNWWSMIQQALLDLIWPLPGVWDDIGKTWEILKKTHIDICRLDIGGLVDDGIWYWRVLNQILGRLWGWFFLAAVAVGAAATSEGGPTLVAGAAAGAALALKVGEVLLISTVAAETAAIIKATFDLFVVDKDEQDTANLGDEQRKKENEKREEDYRQIAESTMALAMIGAMFALGQIAAQIVKAFRGAVARLRAFVFPEKPLMPKPVPIVDPAIKSLAPSDAATKMGLPEAPEGHEWAKTGDPGKEKLELRKTAAVRQTGPKKVYDPAKPEGEQFPDASEYSKSKKGPKPLLPKQVTIDSAYEGLAAKDAAAKMGLPKPPPGYDWAVSENGNMFVKKGYIPNDAPEMVYDPDTKAIAPAEDYRPRTKEVSPEPTVPKGELKNAHDAVKAQEFVKQFEAETKTSASDKNGNLKQSGFHDDQVVKDVQQLEKEIGHEPKPEPAMDQGEPGKYNSCHAEKKVATTTDGPIGVSKEMCPDCYRFFTKLAKARGKVIMVADPGGLRIFYPDLTIMTVTTVPPIVGANAATDLTDKPKPEPVAQ